MNPNIYRILQNITIYLRWTAIDQGRLSYVSICIMVDTDSSVSGLSQIDSDILLYL